VADQRLPADDRQERGDRRRRADGAEPRERILGEKPQRCFEGLTAEDVERRETAVVEGLRNRQSMAEAQPADHQRLLPMAERRLHQL
jgi:hypothetical protein